MVQLVHHRKISTCLLQKMIMGYNFPNKAITQFFVISPVTIGHKLTMLTLNLPSSFTLLLLDQPIDIWLIKGNELQFSHIFLHSTPSFINNSAQQYLSSLQPPGEKFGEIACCNGWCWGWVLDMLMNYLRV